jgi:hypothetical protein
VKITSFRELRVYQNAIEAAMEVFEITKTFPAEEKFSIINRFIALSLRLSVASSHILKVVLKSH